MGMRLSAAVLSVELSSLLLCDALRFLSHLDLVPARFCQKCVGDLLCRQDHASNCDAHAKARTKDLFGITQQQSLPSSLSKKNKKLILS